jgi:hypothetical protein
MRALLTLAFVLWPPPPTRCSSRESSTGSIAGDHGVAGRPRLTDSMACCGHEAKRKG